MIAPPDQATIDALKTKHGDDLTLLEAAEVAVVIKPVGLGPYRMFKKKANDPATVATAGESLFFDVLVYPSREELMKAIEGSPFLLEHFANEVVKSAGAMAEVRAKKL